MGRFKYSIIRYIYDLISNEPINIGIMINDADTKIHDSKIIEDLSIIKNIHKNFKDASLEIIIDTLRYEHESDDTLAEMSELRYQLQFTKPRALIANSRQEALDDLYDRYVTIVKNFPVKKQKSNTKSKHNITKYIDKTISELEINKKDYIKNHIFKSKEHQVELDYTFKNGKITDTIKIIPININNEKETRANAALFIFDYKHIKDENKGIKFHVIIDDNSKSNSRKTNKIAKMVMEDLAHTKLSVKKSEDIRKCLTEIKKRIAR